LKERHGGNCTFLSTYCLLSGMRTQFKLEN
jgi:hypothetical protein